MPQVLIADIGATNSRFAIIGDDGRPDRVLSFADDGVENVEAAIERYAGLTKVKPDAAVLAVAGPVDGDVITMTNRDWRFSLKELAERFGFSSIRAVNDFEAVAWSLERLTPNDVRPIGSVQKPPDGTKVVLGPGTGMGVGALVQFEGGRQVIATEGGHVAFGCASTEEEPVFARLRKACGKVSAESVLSGPGLERLHDALHNSKRKLSTEAILKYAKAGDDAEADTIALFVRLLGRFAGDVALMFKALGGVYIAGGVAQKMVTLFDHTAFRNAFEAHPPYEKLLRAIPTSLITLDEPGLLGCTVIAERMLAEDKAA